MSRVPTFSGWERFRDGSRLPHVPHSLACDDCGGHDEEHERWCSRRRDQSVGAEFIATRGDGSGDWSDR